MYENDAKYTRKRKFVMLVRQTHRLYSVEILLQFGAVDQGTVAEAIFTIRNIMDFDISVRCRIARTPARKAENQRIQYKHR